MLPSLMAARFFAVALCSFLFLALGYTSTGQDVGSIVTNDVFNKFAYNVGNSGCPGYGFYTYDAFLSAAAAFSGFGTTGDIDTTKRELAAFFANIAHETSGLCKINEDNPPMDYCSVGQWPCAAGQSYYGRGPIQISWNYNYGPAGVSLNFDGINNPSIVATDAVISFKTAVWFWMTQPSSGGSCHTVMVNNQGFAETIRIINSSECGSGGSNPEMQDRVTNYKNYCGILGVDPGSNLTC